MRYERGLTIGQVAEGAKLSRPTVRSVELDPTTISAPTARALADFYEISVAELLGIDTEAAA